MSITIRSLTQRHLGKIAVICIYSYLVFSMYYIFGMNSELVKVITRVLIVILYIYMACSVFILSIGNIKNLYSQLRVIMGQGFNELQKELEKKMRMYFAFGILMDLCFIGGIVEHLYLLITDVKDIEKHWIEGIESLVYWLMYLIIIFLFNPCFFTVAFRMASDIPNEVKGGINSRRK